MCACPRFQEKVQQTPTAWQQSSIIVYRRYLRKRICRIPPNHASSVMSEWLLRPTGNSSKRGRCVEVTKVSTVLVHCEGTLISCIGLLKVQSTCHIVQSQQTCLAASLAWNGLRAQACTHPCRNPHVMPMLCRKERPWLCPACLAPLQLLHRESHRERQSTSRAEGFGAERR